ncbi:MAG TPA: sigma-70 family RNA polymerase sigma factor [Thermoanaerobaculia bacterium]|nr:sigma-70 family RNA polymerase sigma factor [Thermoanaerobaculia bacterium]
MSGTQPFDRAPSEGSHATLGDVLYAKKKSIVSEREWVALVRAVAAGDETALHALYERAHRPVYTLIVRITANRETAEELTLDVFHDIWRRASQYDPANGTVLGWMMNQARSRAIDRLRFDQRKKRVTPPSCDPAQLTPAADPHDLLAFKEQSEVLRSALTALTPDERRAIEEAFFSQLTYNEVAARLNVPLGTIKTRIRSGLQKLKRNLAGRTTR